MQRIVELVANHRKLVERFIKWSVVGTIGAVVDYTILIALVERVGLYALIAQAVSFTCAVVNNYILNRTWTFGDIKHKGPAVQFTQFFIVSILGLLPRTVIMYILLEWLGMWYRVAWAIAIIVVLIWNFFANLVWTFREAE
ncbi:MAG: GtrA family protein [Anaerolineae bacterium]|nr:GtrA family protein [Anaerolineae bacterium]